jgi:hypothetical protein
VIASTGVASTWMMRGGVHAPDEQRQARQCRPGARSLWIVTMKFRPVRIDENPRMNTREGHRDDRELEVEYGV